MSDYRIVINEQTRQYRVERRRWWGWGFVMDASGTDYATFARYEDARGFVCKRLQADNRPHRRWQVVDACARECPSG
jgi:hypothetical protein